MEQKKAETKGKVCVTGASGYFASRLVQRLLSSGYHVIGTVRDPGNVKKVEHLWRLEGAKDRLLLVRADLMEPGSFDDAVMGCHGVFHTASPVLDATHSKEDTLKPAVEGTLNVLRSCKKNPSLRRVVLTSSSSTVRGKEDNFDPKIPLDESSWTSVQWCERLKFWYALAKTLAEKAAWEFCNEHGIDLVTVLPTVIIGPSLPRDLCYTANSVLSLLRGEAEPFMYLGRVGYVHIDDAALCHILAFENKDAQGRYLCSSTVLEAADLASLLSSRYPSFPIKKSCRVPELLGYALFEVPGLRVLWGLISRPPGAWPRDRHGYPSCGASNTPYYDYNTSKAEKLGIKFKSVEEMFDDCITSLLEQGHLSSP